MLLLISVAVQGRKNRPVLYMVDADIYKFNTKSFSSFVQFGGPAISESDRQNHIQYLEAYSSSLASRGEVIDESQSSPKQEESEDEYFQGAVREKKNE